MNKSPAELAKAAGHKHSPPARNQSLHRLPGIGR